MRYWTNKQEAELRRRWEADETGAEIAKAMGRSRCAVLGKLYRLGCMGPSADEVLRKNRIRVREWQAMKRAMKRIERTLAEIAA